MTRWQADLLLRGGRVFTGDGFAEALTARGDRVLGVGDEAELRGAVGARTRVIDLEGGLALPGFHDAHTHLLGGALAAEQLELTAVRSTEELARAVAERIAAQGEEAWVLGRGWDADFFPGGRWPDRAVVDAVSPRTPVLLRRRDGHAALANQRALERAGIGPGTPDPAGGRILRGAAGAPTGILLEDPAMDLVDAHVPPPDRTTQERAVGRAAARAAALGITSVQDDPSFSDALAPGPVYTALWERGELPIRVDVWRALGRDLDALRAEEAELAASGPPGDRVRYGLLKGYLDGSVGSRTALLFEPYSDQPEAGRGVPVTDPEVIRARVLEAHAAGYQVGLHAIGDRAAALALDAVEAAAEAHGAGSVAAARHRVEHAQLFRREDVGRLARLGAVASVQPIHLAADMRVVPARVGAERAAGAYPWRSLQEAGAILALGTDYPVEPLDPMPGVACAVTRTSPREPELEPYYPHEGVSLADALRAYTLGAARACHREDRLGRLAPGALADVAVLAPDPFRVAGEELDAVGCRLTVVGGRVVHSAERGYP